MDSKEILVFDMHNMAQIGLNTTERDVDLPRGPQGQFEAHFGQKYWQTHGIWGDNA